MEVLHMPFPVYRSPAVADGAVYFGSDDGYRHALNASTGALLWKYRAEGYTLSSPPTVTNGVVYFGSGGRLFVRLEREHGSLPLEVRQRAPSPILRRWWPMAWRTLCPIRGYVYAFNANTGALLWEYGGSSGIPRRRWPTAWFMSGPNSMVCMPWTPAPEHSYGSTRQVGACRLRQRWPMAWCTSGPGL